MQRDWRNTMDNDKLQHYRAISDVFGPYIIGGMICLTILGVCGMILTYNLMELYSQVSR
jgi:hypothetical protein